MHVFWDPALDLAKTDLKAWLNTYDPKHLRFLDGKRPQAFLCRPLTNAQVIRKCNTFGDDLNLYREACFRASVYRVEDAWLRGASSQRTVQPAAMAELQQHVSEGVPSNDVSWLWGEQEMYDLFDPTTVLEVGESVRARTFLPPGTAPTFILPPSSRQLLTQQGGLLAAFSGRRGPRNSRRAGGATTSGDGDAPPGDATAEEPAEGNPLARSFQESMLSGKR